MVSLSLGLGINKVRRRAGGGGSTIANIQAAVANSPNGGFFINTGPEAGYTDGQSASSFSTGIGNITAFAAAPTWSEVDGGFNIANGLKSPGLGGAMKSFFFVVKTSDTGWMNMATSSVSANVGIVAGTAGSVDENAGSPTYYANGAALASPTRATLLAAYSTGAKVLVSIRNIDFTASAQFAVNFNLFRWHDASTGFNLSGLFCDPVLIDDQGDAVAGGVEADLAVRHGIVLP